jgi:hypothetical protein
VIRRSYPSLSFQSSIFDLHVSRHRRIVDESLANIYGGGAIASIIIPDGASSRVDDANARGSSPGARYQY